MVIYHWLWWWFADLPIVPKQAELCFQPHITYALHVVSHCDSLLTKKNENQKVRRLWVCSWSLFEKWYTSKPHLCHKTFPLRIICENLSNFETIDNSNSFKWLFGIIIEIFIPTNILDLLLFCWLVCWGFIYLNLVNFTKLLCMFLIKTKNLNVTWKNKSHFSSITFTHTDTLWKITPKNKWPTPFSGTPSYYYYYYHTNTISNLANSKIYADKKTNH